MLIFLDSSFSSIYFFNRSIFLDLSFDINFIKYNKN